MLFSLNPTTDVLRRLWAMQGNISYGGIPANVNILREVGFDAGSEVIRREASGLYPGFFTYASSDETVIWIQGATPANGVAMSYAAARGPVNADTDWLLTCFHTAGRYIRDAIVAQDPLWFRNKLTIVGHSYGGACAIGLLAALIDNYQAADVCTVIVGSPRPGYQWCWDRLAPRRIYRYFSDVDTVPRIIPNWNESPNLHAWLTSAQSQRVSRCVQGAIGLQLSALGAVQEAYLPPQLVDDAGYSIAAWLTEKMRPDSPTHSWTHYMGLFNERASRFPTPQANVQIGQAEYFEEPTPWPIPQAGRAAISVARNDVIQQGRDQNSVPRNVTSKLLLSVRPSGGLFDVIWQEQVIATFDKRGYALKFASAGNRWIKILQRSINIPSGSWEDVIREFLATASSSSGAATPRFRVTGPAATD